MKASKLPVKLVTNGTLELGYIHKEMLDDEEQQGLGPEELSKSTIFRLRAKMANMTKLHLTAPYMGQWRHQDIKLPKPKGTGHGQSLEEAHDDSFDTLSQTSSIAPSSTSTIISPKPVAVRLSIDSELMVEMLGTGMTNDPHPKATTKVPKRIAEAIPPTLEKVMSRDPRKGPDMAATRTMLAWLPIVGGVRTRTLEE